MKKLVSASLFLLVALSGCGSRQVICEADTGLIRPIELPAKPIRPTYGNVITDFVELQTTVKLDNEKKVRFLEQLNNE